jgi:hypothetical protein
MRNVVAVGVRPRFPKVKNYLKSYIVSSAMKSAKRLFAKGRLFRTLAGQLTGLTRDA